MLDATGVSPYAALRPLIVVGLGSYLVTGVLSLLLGNRDAAAAMTLVLLLSLLSLSNLALLALLLAIAAFIAMLAVAGRRRPLRIRWHLFTRALSIVTAIALLAVGIRSIQDGRVAQVLGDIAREGPFRGSTPGVAADLTHPDVTSSSSTDIRGPTSCAPCSASTTGSSWTCFASRGSMSQRTADPTTCTRSYAGKHVQRPSP